MWCGQMTLPRGKTRTWTSTVKVLVSCQLLIFFFGCLRTSGHPIGNLTSWCYYVGSVLFGAYCYLGEKLKFPKNPTALSSNSRYTRHTSKLTSVPVSAVGSLLYIPWLNHVYPMLTYHLTWRPTGHSTLEKGGAPRGCLESPTPNMPNSMTLIAFNKTVKRTFQTGFKQTDTLTDFSSCYFTAWKFSRSIKKNFNFTGK